MERNNDCYFYYYSTCTKESTCPFRHCGAALGSEVVCELWRIGRCKDQQCPFRHMLPNINRSVKPCWFETQPEGCKKPHCVFMHTKPRPSISELQDKKAEWILPIGLNNSKLKDTVSTNEVNTTNNNDQIGEKINITLDKDEESDGQENNETVAAVNESSVKTLEQIRVEKFLNSDLDHLIDSSNNTTTTTTNNNNNKSSIKPGMDKTSTKKTEPVTFIVKTLDQIRKEREEKEEKECSTTLKENQRPNLLKRDNQEEMKNTKPVKIRRNRLNPTAGNSSQLNESPKKETQNFNKPNNLTIDQECLDLHSDIELDLFYSNQEDTHEIDQFNIDDDELMRELDQVINS